MEVGLEISMKKSSYLIKVIIQNVNNNNQRSISKREYDEINQTSTTQIPITTTTPVGEISLLENTPRTSVDAKIIDNEINALNVSEASQNKEPRLVKFCGVDFEKNSTSEIANNLRQHNEHNESESDDNEILLNGIFNTNSQT